MTTKRWLMAMAMLAATPALAQAPKAAAPGTAAAPELAPGAKEALDRTGYYLRSLKSFEVTAVGATEKVLENGQKLSFPGQLSYAVQMPDKLYLETVNDRQQRRFFYDGKTLTIEVPRAQLYTDAPLPGTIATLAETAEAKYGVELPLQDLFEWGTGRMTVPTSGFRVGPGTIAGTLCDHYAFRQKGTDWQVWIEKGDKPLPRRIVITNAADPAHPQYDAVLTWNVNPALAAGRFAYKAPAGTSRMAILAATGEAK